MEDSDFNSSTTYSMTALSDIDKIRTICESDIVGEVRTSDTNNINSIDVFYGNSNISVKVKIKL